MLKTTQDQSYRTDGECNALVESRQLANEANAYRQGVAAGIAVTCNGPSTPEPVTP